MFYFPRTDNPIVSLYPQSDLCRLCEEHFKSKEKVSTIRSVGFRTLKEYATKWTAVGKGPSSFQKFFVILDKCNTITAELLENEIVKCHPQCQCDFPNDIKLHKILKQQTKEKEKISTEIIVELQQEDSSDIRTRCKSKEIMKEEKCFACDKKIKRRKKSRRLETLSRVERDDGSATLIYVMKKNEDLSDQWLHSTAKQLKVMTSNVEVFTADVFYNQSCYNRFVL